MVCGCIYHPKSKCTAESDETLKHIAETMVKLSTKYTDRFIIGGDFNHLDMTDMGQEKKLVAATKKTKK